jgi:hypothetical protein
MRHSGEVAQFESREYQSLYRTDEERQADKPESNSRRSSKVLSQKPLQLDGWPCVAKAISIDTVVGLFLGQRLELGDSNFDHVFESRR